MITLETQRLYMRELHIDDANDVFEYCKLLNVVGMVGMRLHTSIELTKKYIAHELQKSETFAIVLKESGKMIGSVSLRRQYNESDLDIRLISCIINPKYWGKGYAPEAIKELIKYAFDIESVHKILGGHYSFNTQSERLNKKLGFVYEGTQREVIKYEGNLVDVVEYSLLYKDYLEASKNW